MAETPDTAAEPKKAATVVLAVNPVHSDEYTFDSKHDPITAAGTEVPAGKVKEIIAAAAAVGIQIREVS